MNTLEANTRNTKSKGDVRSLRLKGSVPAIIYGGSEQNEKVSVSKKILKSLLDKEGFLSSIITLNVDGKNQNVLPREITYNVLSDEPTHIDFLRIVSGVKIRIEVPVQFINHEKSPGLKKGGVLNIVRRRIELKCPSDKIPEVITIDLDGVDIGESFKISSIKLEEGVNPTITGRDFVIATLAAPTVMKEPEKPAEAETAEGEEAATDDKNAAPSTEADKKDGDKKDGDKKDGDKKDGDEKKAPVEKK
jgi:large subunit ribosomal protein L25